MALEKLCYTIREASEVTTVCKSTLYMHIRSGALKARKLGKKTLILADDLKAWIAGNATAA